MITKESIKEFQQGVGTAAWVLDHDRFCAATGFESSDYSLQKFKELQQLAAFAGAFTPDVLEKIISACKEKT
jgi:5-methylthioribose kinase